MHLFPYMSYAVACFVEFLGWGRRLDNFSIGARLIARSPARWFAQSPVRSLDHSPNRSAARSIARFGKFDTIGSYGVVCAQPASLHTLTFEPRSSSKASEVRSPFLCCFYGAVCVCVRPTDAPSSPIETQVTYFAQS